MWQLKSQKECMGPGEIKRDGTSHETPSTVRGRSETVPIMTQPRNRQSATRARASGTHLSKSSPMSPNTAPVMKSDKPRSPNAAPATMNTPTPLLDATLPIDSSTNSAPAVSQLNFLWQPVFQMTLVVIGKGLLLGVKQGQVGSRKYMLSTSWGKSSN